MDFKRDDYCFACGKKNKYGLKLDIQTDQGSSKATIKFPDYTQGYNGIVHGGILATILDEMAVYAGVSLGKKFVTAELTVRFKKPVKTGVEYIGEGKVIQDRGRFIRTSSIIRDPDGSIFAEGTAKLMRVNDQL